MANPVLQQLIANMRASGLDLTGRPSELRIQFEEMFDAMPEPPGVAFHEIMLGGVPALECRSDTASQDKVLLYFHGGGYVVGSAKAYRGLAGTLGSAAEMLTYAFDYRLAPEAPFPEAIDDAVSAYRALIDSGRDPKQIVFAGDSAGGGLVMATLLSLRDQGIALPAAALLMSPWVDLACEGESFITKADEDPSLTPEGVRAVAGHYLGAADVRNPLASPLYASLSGLPPMLIQVGSAEILLDDAVRLAGRAGAAGTKVDLQIWPEMIHVWQSFAFILPEGRDAITAAAGFLRTHSAGQD